MRAIVLGGKRSLEVRGAGFVLLALLLLAGCANIVVPTGGPKDEAGPKTIRVNPADSSLNFKGKEVTFYFDEFLSPGDAASVVFMTPLPDIRPDISLVGKRLNIRFNGPLRDSTTYVITLGTSLRDFHERNAISKPLQYAFSTGAVLDTGRVSGQLLDARTGLGMKGVVVMLPADSLPVGDTMPRLENRAPMYAALTDEKGGFELGFIRPGTYSLLGMTDQDGDFRWTLPGEKIAFDDSAWVQVGAGLPKPQRKLWAWLPDTSAPLPNKAEWLSPGWLLFSASEALDTLQASFAGQALPQLGTWAGDARTRVLRMPPDCPPDSFALELRLSDTLAHVRDTLFKVYPGKVPRVLSRRLTAVLGCPTCLLLELNDSVPLVDTSLARYIYLSDSTHQKLPLRIVPARGPRLLLDLASATDSLMPYMLHIDSTLLSVNGLKADTSLRLAWRAPDLSALGSLSGRVEGAPGPVLVWLLAEGAQEPLRVALGPAFSFAALKPGTYTLALVHDADANGRWTPPRLRPWKMAERIYRIPEPVRVRAGWDVENYLLKWE